MAINVEQVKALRERTGSGVLDCRNALQEAQGDVEKAVEILRKKGLAKASAKATRETGQGVVRAYIHHDAQLGVLIELGCETDFVARNQEFVSLGDDLAMHVAAKQPLYLSAQDAPEELVAREMEIYRDQARAEGKPEKILDRIAQGRLEKFYEDTCLLEQSFVRDEELKTKRKVKDVLAEKIALLGENIQIKRFVRMRVGEQPLAGHV